MSWIRRILKGIVSYGHALRRILRSTTSRGATSATQKLNPPRSAQAATRPTPSPSRRWVRVPVSRVLPPNLRWRVENAATRFTRSHRIGDGGQGRVYAVQGRPDVVLKEFDRPIPGALPDFERLVESREAVERHLADVRVDLCWPAEAHVNGDELVGYVMPRIRADYYFPAARSGKDIERSLAWAVREASALSLPFIVNDQQRVQLVWLVGRFLDAMHREGLAYGDISWANFSFQIDPEVRLVVYDFDSTRIIGRRTLTRAPAAHTIDWGDPKTRTGDPATFDTDRYRFALLAYRMLVSKRLDDQIDLAQVPDQIPTFDDRQVRHLRSLWVRTEGERGTRPTIHEWLCALGS